jgi:hypothetical protein
MDISMAVEPVVTLDEHGVTRMRPPWAYPGQDKRFDAAGDGRRFPR